MEEKGSIRLHVEKVIFASEEACREYAFPGGRQENKQEKADWNRERERMKEMLLPFVREAVKKQLREEREYYKSRPSMAVKQVESILGAGSLENAFVPVVADRVYQQLEERIRREWVRKGR